ncbi:MAG: hypothetical protein LKJ17_10745 [Oscillospiraceae bacterium]|jgi:hypothetical protein|nr:hypothetical protein [Oscillospiraceae bacterium]
MKKFMHSLIAFMLVAAIMVPSTVSGFAAEKRNTLKTPPALSQTQKDKFNDWVTYDEEANQFSVKTGASDALGQADYELLNQCLTVTNSNIAMADFSSGEAFVVLPEDHGTNVSEGKRPNKGIADFPSKKSFVISSEDEEKSALGASRFREGVTKINFHWWGATIYLSKTTINLIGAGVSVGGIWVPEPVVSKILATLGVVVALCPGGIVFDYNYVLAGIGVLLPGAWIMFPAVSNIRWQ